MVTCKRKRNRVKRKVLAEKVFSRRKSFLNWCLKTTIFLFWGRKGIWVWILPGVVNSCSLPSIQPISKLRWRRTKIRILMEALVLGYVNNMRRQGRKHFILSAFLTNFFSSSVSIGINPYLEFRTITKTRKTKKVILPQSRENCGKILKSIWPSFWVWVGGFRM